METRQNRNLAAGSVLALACSLPILLGACGSGSESTDKAFHLVVIAMGQGGSSNAADLPNTAQFEKISTSFALAPSSPAPPLRTSASMLTGLTPGEHGAGNGPEGDSKLEADQTPMAEYLVDHGYNTSAVLSSDCNMPPESGFNQGFGDYQAIPGGATDLAVLASDWIEHHYRQPFFVFVHMPVTAPAADAAARGDEALGMLLKSLASHGLLDSALVVLRNPDGRLLIKAPGQRAAKADPRSIHDHHLPQLVLEHMALPVAAVRPNSYFTHPLPPLEIPAPQ